MNNRIDNCFKKKNKKLITFLVMNDPDYETSIDSCKAMIDNGADIIELGIPFADPIAEGNVIERANNRALKNGFDTKQIFEYVSKIRKYNNEIPLLFLTYYNILYKNGVENFVKKSKEAGIDGFIIPDLPFEENSNLKQVCDEYNLNIINMVSLTSKDRVEKIAKNSNDFLYCVSSMGVTGVRKDISKSVFDLSKEISKHSDVKKAIGFGISNQEQIKELKEYYDGVIIGSAFVKKFENDNIYDISSSVGQLTKHFKEVL